MRSPPSVAVRPGWMHRWWLDRPMRAKGAVVVAVPLIALVAVSSASLVMEHNERQERGVALTASSLSTAAQQVLSDAVNAETGVRGFAATGEAVLVAPDSVRWTRCAR